MAHHNFFSHSGRDGSDPAQRVERAGYRYRATGENIAGHGTYPLMQMSGSTRATFFARPAAAAASTTAETFL